MVFDASARPNPLANSVNECMHTGPSLQPLMWDNLIRERMSPHLVLADIQKAFLQVGLKEEDRDAFRFLFNMSKFKEEATHIFESAQFPIHKWESNVLELDTEPNPSKILGHFWDKREDSLEIKVDASSTEGSPVTKRTILSKLSGVYDH